MTKVNPFIKCVDYWPDRIPENKLRAYHEMIESGQIQKHHVIVNRKSGATIVEYYSTIPHEWILEELARIVNESEKEGDEER